MIPTFVQTSLYSAVLALFSSGANGAFLDANDWGPTGTGGTGVVFQDAAGTLPVTAMEQPVGLVLDKSQGLTLGAELVTNGSNLTTTTGWTAAQNGTLAAVGGNLQITNGATLSGAGYQAFATVTGKWYKATVTYTPGTSGTNIIRCGSGSFGTTEYLNKTGVSAGKLTFYFLAVSTLAVISFYTGTVNAGDTASFGSISCKSIAGNHAYVSASANRPTITARYNLLLATAVLSTQSVTVGAGSYTLYFTGSGSVALSGAATGTKTAGSNVITCTAGTLTLTVTGSVLTADLRPTDQATGLIPTYQRVNTATDYDWSPAFPPMIRGNGSNQYLTGNLDLSSTNKVTVWCGLRSTSAASEQMLFELGNYATTNGSLAIGNWYLSRWYFTAKNNGIPQRYTSGATPPITNTLSCLYDLSAATVPLQVSPRVNGAVPSITDAGSLATSGNFGNLPYYVLSRGGSSLFFNGGFNSLVILGAAATAAQISTTEAYCNQKLRAY